MTLGTETEQKRMMNDRNILQNILNIPIIEIEQLNPRILGVHGAMVVKFRKTGGDTGDVLSYEYDWSGGELYFIDNPYPRPPIGTGKVGYLCDDERDPSGSPIAVPAGSLSGATYGWNKEFLASHYGECYWKIVDPEIDADVQNRYFNILISLGKTKAEAQAMLDDAIEMQAKGVGATNVSIKRTSSMPINTKIQIKPVQRVTEMENNPMFKRIMDENEMLKTTLKEINAQLKNKTVSVPSKQESTQAELPLGEIKKEIDKGKKKVEKREKFIANMKRGRDEAKAKRSSDKKLAGNLTG